MKIKRLLALLLSVMLLVQTVPMVLAESEATITIGSASAQRGKTVTVTISAQNLPKVKSMMIVPKYDDTVLELISGKWLIRGSVTGDWDAEYGDAVVQYESETDINTGFFELTFKVKEDAPVGTSVKITCDEFTVKTMKDNQDVPVDFTLVDGSISVICLHEEKVEVPEQAPFCLVAGNNRYYTCDCGAVLKADGVTETTVEAETIPALNHDWDDPTCTAPKTCKRPNCGATEGASLGHLWTEKIEDAQHLKDTAANCTQYNTYWFDCYRCDAISSTEYFTSNTAGPHIYTERIEDAAHQVSGTGLNCQDAKEFYFDCAYCDHIGEDSFVSDQMGAHRMSAQWTTENDKHFHKCTVANCDYIEDEQACYGGTATCLEKAVCQECKKAYGSLGNHELTHHARNEADHTKPGNIEYWTCDTCGKYFSDASAENEIIEKDTMIQQIPHSHSKTWSNNATQHWNECSCGDKINVYNHVYDNTCDTTCNTCGYVRTITHTWKTTLTYSATQHWTECSVCGEKKDVEDHHGGTATCLAKAKCADCGQRYGSYGKHEMTHHSEVPADHYKPGNVEYWTCGVCEGFFLDEEGDFEVFEDDTVIGKIPHSHSKQWSKNATQHWNECSCGDKINVNNHVYDNTCDTTCNTCGYVRTITHTWKTSLTYSATQHWTECSVCGEKKDVEDHHGGTATCLAKAECVDCGQKYGKLGNHELTHHSKVDADHFGSGNIEYWTCDTCGKYFSDASAENEITEKDTVIQQIPHSHSKTWSNNATQHWNECSCGDKINVYNHVYDNTCDTTCNTCGYVRTITHTWKTNLTYNATQHWTECSVCGEKKDVEDHHGGTATCLSKAQCADCKQAYGELADCDLTGEKAEATYLKNEATCKTAAEYYKSCKVCGKASTETFFHGEPDSNNHVGGTEIRDAAEATCTSDGYTGDTYCKGCNAKLESGTVIPGGHSMNKVDGIPATHEAGGNIEHYTCSACGKLFADEKGDEELTADEVLIPKGEHAYDETYTADENGHWKECECGSKIEEGTHTYGEWTVVKKADIGVEGSEERECPVCGYKQTRKIPAIHSPATGDSSQLMLWTTLLILSVCGMAVILFVIPRKKGRYTK